MINPSLKSCIANINNYDALYEDEYKIDNGA